MIKEELAIEKENYLFTRKSDIYDFKYEPTRKTL